MIPRYIIKYSVFLIAFLTGAVGTISGQPSPRKTSAAEKRADRNFVRQDFDKAMALYETVPGRGRRAGDTVEVHLKIARLYFMLRDYPGAAVHYGKAKRAHPDALSVRDACDYIDALRFQGRNTEAEAVALEYNYKDIYSKYQRYQNILDALAMQHDMRADVPFTVRRLSINTPMSEYWVGMFGDRYIYSASYSNFNDPGKLFYHRTKYYELNERDKPIRKDEPAVPASEDFFRGIPVDLQVGPFSLSQEMDLMVGTSTGHGKKSAITDVGSTTRPFKTRLVYSRINPKQNRFTKYYNVFRQEAGASYAHPCLVNEGRSLIFTSDRPGGYGGFDLYISHWDSMNRVWGEPENLGPGVNTEGDEIFPVLYGGTLIFSSNGHKGFGGYDIFTVMYENGKVLENSLRHLPYPINTEFNDTYMLPLDDVSGYLVSDRNLGAGDDIYYYRALETSDRDKGGDFFGVAEHHAVLGGNPVITNTTERDREMRRIAVDKYRDNWELAHTVYFDFDCYGLNEAALVALKEFLKSYNLYHYKELGIIGYTDIIGREAYNISLSKKRAQAVARYLDLRTKAPVQFNVEGRGPLRLRPEELERPLYDDEYTDRISMNRKARRVDIYIK